MEKIFGFFLFFRPQHVGCGILVPHPGIEPVPPALEAWSLNHWTAREVPAWKNFNIHKIKRIENPDVPLTQLHKFPTFCPACFILSQLFFPFC